MTDRKIIETMSQAECEAAEIAMWADMLDMCREERAAALARAEAAEASREALADRLVFEMEQRETLAARVAELEATLISNSELDNGPWHVLSETVAERNRLADRVAELEAAQQWRPVTEWRPIVGPPPADAFELKIICEVADDGTIYNAQTGATITYWTPRSDKTWRPIPPTHEELQ